MSLPLPQPPEAQGSSEQGGWKVSGPHPTQDRKDLPRKMNEKVGGDPNIHTIYFLSVLHKSDSVYYFWNQKHVFCIT